MNQKELKGVAESCAEKVKNTVCNEGYFESPFKHLVIDDFLPFEMAQACLSAFPASSQGMAGWDYQDDKDIEVKYRTNWSSEFDIPDCVLPIVRILNSSLFLKAMQSRFEINKIVPDPYFSGGGLNVTEPGGLLDVHVDGNYHDATGLNRRLNAILYLNPGWQDDWGGEFGLYDEGGLRCVKKVAPLFNRLVIFDTHDKSYHGLPDALNFPEGNSRKSLILYYYTKAPRPEHLIELDSPHSALWVRRGMTDKRGNKTRDFE
jgi:Rps23 Pro-64 3,4-dihydroxylase Tpa1-like proline 4-hydroxylase